MGARLHTKGVWSVAPTRTGCRRGRHRKILRDYFDHGLYWQRNIIEAMFGAVKRLFGGHVRGRTWRAQRAEISMRHILYNEKAPKQCYLLLSPKEVHAGRPRSVEQNTNIV
jgi:hypothetical protein